ncbi:hypothetical protein MD484_g2490, partial [Candolleomyces efflorescens]
MDLSFTLSTSAEIGHYVQNPVDSERWVIYAIVIAVFVLELTAMILLAVYTARALFDPLGPKHNVMYSRWSVVSPALYGAVPLIVHIFFAWKIRTLGRSVLSRIIVPSIICIVTLTQFVAALGITVRFAEAIGVDTRPVILEIFVIIQRVGTLVCDTLVTVSMVVILTRYKSKTRLPATQNLLDKLTINAVENGAVTMVFTALSLGFFLAQRDTFVHSGFQEAVGRLYANVLMASLNGRTMHKWERRCVVSSPESSHFPSRVAADAFLPTAATAAAIDVIPLYSDLDTESTTRRPPSWPKRAWRIAMKELAGSREWYGLVRLERDRRRGIEVISVLVLELAAMILLAVYTARALFDPLGPKHNIMYSKWSLVSPALYGAVALIVHMFFAWKIRTLGRSVLARIIVPSIICIVTLAQFVGALGITIRKR